MTLDILRTQTPPPRVGALDRLAPAIARVSAYARTHRTGLSRTGLAVALVIFSVELAWAIHGTPDLWARITLLPLLVLVFLGVPATIVLNTAEFRAMIEAAGHAMPWRTAFGISVYTSAANMLPLPGGVLTRIAGLLGEGVGVRRGSWLILLFAGIWAGTAFCFSGAAIAPHSAGLGAAFLLAGIVALAVALIGLRRHGASYRLIGKIVCIRIALLVVEIARLMLAFMTVGAVIHPADAAIFSISSLVGTAASIVPAGLGVREAVIALLSPVAGLDAALGVLSGTTSRIADVLVLCLLSGVLFVLAGRRKPS